LRRVFLLHHEAGCGQAGDVAAGAALGDARRLAAMSRSRAPRSRAMHSSIRAWLVRRRQLATLNSWLVFLEIYC